MTPVPGKSRLPWTELLINLIGSRLVILVVAFLSTLVVDAGRFYNGATQVFASFYSWDSTWFVGIAKDGYTYSETEMSSAAFFPLYPLLIRALEIVTGDPRVAGAILSNAAFFGVCVLLWKLVEAEREEAGAPFEEGDGGRAVKALVFGPVSFFFSIVYSESTFLFFVLASLYGARRKNLWLAGGAGLAAALTRNAGLLLAVPLALEWFQVRWTKPYLTWPNTWKPLAACVAPVAGFALWAGYLWFQFGVPLAVLKVQKAWARKLTWPWQSLEPGHLKAFPAFYHVWFVGCAVTAILLIAYTFRMKLRPSYAVLGLVMLLLNLSGRHLEAIPRLLSVIFPLYLALAVLLRRYPKYETLWLCFSTSLLALSTVLFCNGYWFT